MTREITVIVSRVVVTVEELDPETGEVLGTHQVIHEEEKPIVPGQLGPRHDRGCDYRRL